MIILILLFKEFFGIPADNQSIANELLESTRVGFDQESFYRLNHLANDFFQINPIEYSKKTFEYGHEVYINKIHVTLDNLVESYRRAISILKIN